MDDTLAYLTRFVVDAIDGPLDLDRKREVTRSHLYTLEAHLWSLEHAGIYASLPIEDWQQRARQRFLYLVFRPGPNGLYPSPNGCRKFYVGHDPARVADARGRIQRRREWEQIAGLRDQVRAWLETGIDTLPRPKSLPGSN